MCKPNQICYCSELAYTKNTTIIKGDLAPLANMILHQSSVGVDLGSKSPPLCPSPLKMEKEKKNPHWPDRKGKYAFGEVNDTMVNLYVIIELKSLIFEENQCDLFINCFADQLQCNLLQSSELKVPYI